ncbi:MAG: hypothetical protein ACLQVL_01770 [Terriglobia bacterium]
MNNELLDVMRAANHEFQEFIDQATQNGAKVVESRGAAHRLGKVDLRLKQVSEQLLAGSRLSRQEPEVAYEIMKYRENLKALRSVMETLQFSLLAEKSRLENVRANMQSACAWAASLREIS